MPVTISTAHLITTGGKVWSASHELLTFLLSSLPETPLTILELGSGCGHLGLSLAEARPECRVILTERQLDGGFQHLMENLQNNLHIKNVHCFQLDWADNGEFRNVYDFALSLGHPITLVGSELVYNPTTCNLLCLLIDKFSRKNKNVTFIYAHSLNRFSMIDYDLFTKLSSAGFCITSHKEPDRVLTDLAAMPPSLSALCQALCVM